MLKKANSIKMDKRGLSEIVAYAIMIAIAISLAVAVFAWLRIVANPSAPVDCKEGTSVYLESYSCDPTTSDFGLIIKNNGGFDVDGVIVKVSNDVANEPTIALQPDAAGGVLPGYYQFISIPPNGKLKPGMSWNANFTNTSSGPIKRISYQPFVFINNKKVVCGGTAQKEPVVGNGC